MNIHLNEEMNMKIADILRISEDPSQMYAAKYIEQLRDQHTNMYGLLKTLRQSKSMVRYWNNKPAMSVLVDKILQEASR